MKIVVLDGAAGGLGDLLDQELKNFGEVYIYDRSTKEEAAERTQGAEVIFTNKVPIDAGFMRSHPELKYIGVLATGYNIIDVKAAKEYGITVTNIPAYSTASVVQMTIALLLEIALCVGFYNTEVKNKEWEQCPDFCFSKTRLIELAGKTMGIVGYGRIGQAVAKAAESLGMQVIACGRHPEKIRALGAEAVSIDELYERADVISLHCPLTEENFQMINKKSIGKMKDGVIFLNTARGGLVNEKDLAEALKSGKIYAAGVDVVSKEPIEPDNPLLACENCLITPHIAWASQEAKARLARIALDNLNAYLYQEPQNVVSG